MNAWSACTATTERPSASPNAVGGCSLTFRYGCGAAGFQGGALAFFDAHRCGET